ncbi:MAG: hypothetical protein AB1540_06075 [Bdellovibrionota bacterium]
MAFTSPTKINENVREGDLTRKIEEQTGKVPSLGYLSLALGAMAVSATLEFVLRKKEIANFVGLWVPSILIMGLYNKIVKLEHEQSSSGTVGISTEGRLTSYPS